MENLLGLVHGIDYLLTFCLIGFALFYCFILPSGGVVAVGLFSDFAQKFRLIVSMAFISSFIWMILVAHEMAESWAFQEVWNAMTMTRFAHIWCIKVILLFLSFIFVKKVELYRHGYLLIGIFVLSLPLFSVVTGHAYSIEENRLLRILLDLIHSVSVGIWTGGLISLHMWLSRRSKNLIGNSDTSYKVVTRFSHFAMSATVGILLTGSFMAYLSGVNISDPLQSPYSEMVFAKLFIFFGTLGIASINQFIHLRNRRSREEFKFAANIRREVGLEMFLVTLIFILAGFLSRTAVPMP